MTAHDTDPEAAAAATAVYAERYREALGLDDLSSQPYVALTLAMQRLYPAETLRALAVLQAELGGAS